MLTCRTVVNVIVWEKSREKQAAGQSHALGRVMWTSNLPRDTVQPMKTALRNSNEIICKHRKLCLQMPGKVSSESGQSICRYIVDMVDKKLALIINGKCIMCTCTGSELKCSGTAYTVHHYYMYIFLYKGLWKNGSLKSALTHTCNVFVQKWAKLPKLIVEHM